MFDQLKLTYIETLADYNKEILEHLMTGATFDEERVAKINYYNNLICTIINIGDLTSLRDFVIDLEETNPALHDHFWHFYKLRFTEASELDVRIEEARLLNEKIRNRYKSKDKRGGSASTTPSGSLSSIGEVPEIVTPLSSPASLSPRSKSQ